MKCVCCGQPIPELETTILICEDEAQLIWLAETCSSIVDAVGVAQSKNSLDVVTRIPVDGYATLARAFAEVAGLKTVDPKIVPKEHMHLWEGRPGVAQFRCVWCGEIRLNTVEL